MLKVEDHAQTLSTKFGARRPFLAKVIKVQPLRRIRPVSGIRRPIPRNREVGQKSHNRKVCRSGCYESSALGPVVVAIYLHELQGFSGGNPEISKNGKFFNFLGAISRKPFISVKSDITEEIKLKFSLSNEPTPGPVAFFKRGDTRVQKLKTCDFC